MFFLSFFALDFELLKFDECLVIDLFVQFKVSKAFQYKLIDFLCKEKF